MGQVRKDILNGWKEIGGYVCRDIRTVERWEKQRGLPVRRMPGAGRATVYALVSELDEWLESAGPTVLQVTERSTGNLRDVPDSSISAVHRPDSIAQSTPLTTGVEDLPYHPNAEPLVPSASHSFTATHIELHTNTTESLPSFKLFFVQHWIAAATLAATLCLLGFLTWPVIRSHTKPLVARTLEPVIHNENNPVAPYRSRVPGVDDLYLRGVYSYEQRTPESLQRSIEDFSAASAKDPSYAPSYAGLANTYNLLREYAAMPDSEAYPKAKQAAEHAIALDPRLPEAHASLGFIDFFWSWNAPAAEHEFQMALTLDPNSVLAHHWYGSMLLHEGKFAQAVEQLETAQRLQPNSAAILSTRALAMGLDGHRGEAVEMLQDVIYETPGASSPHAILATLSNLEPRDPARYIAEMRRSAELRNDPEALQVFTYASNAYRPRDEMSMWSAIFAAEERLHPGATHRTYLMAEAEAALGKDNDALTDLQQLAGRHDPSVIGILIDPTLTRLHSDHRFIQLAVSFRSPHQLRLNP